LQKDKLIEELRLELAELQIKCMELENRGGGRVQDLEKSLIEARVTNARLMEENESFQSLLMERTLNGEFSKKTPSESGNLGSLADELSAIAEDDHDPEADRVRKLEIEVERQKAENKALTLYINRIIERILKFQGGFETILSNNDDETVPLPATDSLTSTPQKSKDLNKDLNKDLPPPPPRDQGSPSESQGIFQRAKSIAYGALPKQRPLTYIEPSAPSLVEDPTTAPSIPLSRTPSIPLSRSQSKRHSMIIPRRVQTSAEFSNPGAATVVGNMFRPSEELSSASPGIYSPRTTYFSLMHRASSAGPRLASAFEQDEEDGLRPTSSTSAPSDTERSRKDALDALNGADPDKEPSVDTPSPPRSLGAQDNRQVLTGNKIRPLRLVTEEQQKKANRQSWMPNMSTMSGWFNAPNGQPQQPGSGPGPTSS
jgi:hypothetical protein